MLPSGEQLRNKHCTVYDGAMFSTNAVCFYRHIKRLLVAMQCWNDVGHSDVVPRDHLNAKLFLAVIVVKATLWISDVMSPMTVIILKVVQGRLNDLTYFFSAVANGHRTCC